jgi:hypothetical protein
MINRFGGDHHGEFGDRDEKHRGSAGDALGAGLDGVGHGEVWRADPAGSRAGRGAVGPAPLVGPVRAGVDRFTEEQMFEEDVRAVLSMMRPHRHERLMGWSEYRTGGANFRATISWDPGAVEHTGHDDPAGEAHLCIPHLTDVLESILVGSVKNQDELPAEQEFEIYRGVVRELYRRLDEMQGCYE